MRRKHSKWIYIYVVFIVLKRRPFRMLNDSYHSHCRISWWILNNSSNSPAQYLFLPRSFATHMPVVIRPLQCWRLQTNPKYQTTHLSQHLFIHVYVCEFVRAKRTDSVDSSSRQWPNNMTTTTTTNGAYISNKSQKLVGSCLEIFPLESNFVGAGRTLAVNIIQNRKPLDILSTKKTEKNRKVSTHKEERQ